MRPVLDPAADTPLSDAQAALPGLFPLPRPEQTSTPFCSDSEPVGTMNVGILLRRATQEHSRSRRMKGEEGKTAYLFGVSSSVKHFGPQVSAHSHPAHKMASGSRDRLHCLLPRRRGQRRSNRTDTEARPGALSSSRLVRETLSLLWD